MSQQLASTVVARDQSSHSLVLIEQVNTTLPGLITLSPGQRRRVPMMGPKSVHFGRGVIRSLKLNADIVPRTLDVATAAAKLETIDQLLPVLMEVQKLETFLQDTVDALGSDVMVVANQGYQLMKALGKPLGLESVTRELGRRHAKRKRNAQKHVSAPVTETESEA